MRRCFLFISLIVALCVCSCNKRTGKSLDMPPRIEYENSTLLEQALKNDKVFFKDWSENKNYQGYILDIASAEGKNNLNDYAEKRYKEFRKQVKPSRNKYEIRYVLFCSDSHEIIVKMDKFYSNIIEGTNPGDLYRLSCRPYPKPSDAIKALSELKLDSEKKFEKIGWVKKMGFQNPILDTVELALDNMFIPSDSFFYRFFFALPFGAGMVCIKLFNSLHLSCLFFFIMFVICNMAFVRRCHKGKIFDIYSASSWLLGLFAFLSFCCLVNSIEPSSDFRYGLLHYGYADIFNSYYALYYGTYTKGATSTFSVVVIVILIIIDTLISFIENANNSDEEINYSNDNPFGTILFAFFGAVACQNYIGYIVMAYLLFKIIRYIYINSGHAKEDEPKVWPIWIICGLVLTTYLLIPYVTDSNDSHAFVFINCFNVIWGTMALSGLILFIGCYNATKNWGKSLWLFLINTSPREWNIANYMYLNIYCASSLSSPFFLLFYTLYSVFPIISSTIVGVADITLSFVCLFCMVFMFCDLSFKRPFFEFIIRDTWEAISDIPASKNPTYDDRRNVALSRSRIGFGWLGLLWAVPNTIYGVVELIRWII